MSEILLQASRRTPGRSVARALRRTSQVPGIYYFHGETPIAIAASELALRPLIFTSESHIVRMRLDDGIERTCVLKDISFDPITDRPVHFDLQGVAANEAVRVEVPVALVGQPAGQRNGGVVDFILHKLEIECLPQDLPEHIEVDITRLEIGDSLHVGEVTVPNVTIVTAADAAIVAIAAPRNEAAGTGAGASEPEVISKGKSEA
jgi:large subunit ribosomal protein L25